MEQLAIQQQGKLGAALVSHSEPIGAVIGVPRITKLKRILPLFELTPADILGLVQKNFGENAMELKATDILLALMQFLEILVPGAFVAFLAKDYALTEFIRQNGLFPRIENDSQGWVVFFIASYLLGHFIFLLASFLDDWLYDPVRRKWKPLHRDLAFRNASEIKKEHLHGSDDVMNTFKWAKAALNLQFPGAMSEVRRHESDSKFFRSLVIVFLILAGLQVSKSAWAKLVGCVFLAALSFWRYVDQRWKSTESAYQYLIVIDDLQPTLRSGKE